MKLRQELKMNGKTYPKGSEIPWTMIYPFFMIHMLAFGGSGFLMAYSSNQVPVFFLYLHGGFAILVYTVFYLAIFGRDEVKWMFINAALGLFGIYSQIGWLLSLFHKKISDYPAKVHVIPFLYFVLYTFLLRHAIVDLACARENPQKKKLVENCYVAISLALYLIAYFSERR